MLYSSKFKKFIEPYKIDDIKFINSEKNYSKITFSDGLMFKSAYNLKKFEDLFFTNMKFLRIHQSYIINIDFVKQTNIEGGFLKLNYGEVIPIGNKFKTVFLVKNP